MKNNVEMHNPPHPAAILREDILPALGITVTEAAKQLGITRGMLSRILNEHAGITPEMAIRLEVWLGEKNGSSARVWLAHQSAYDLWLARQKWDHVKSQVRKLEVKGSMLR